MAANVSGAREPAGQPAFRHASKDASAQARTGRSEISHHRASSPVGKGQFLGTAGEK